jgi:hypothetical protein
VQCLVFGVQWDVLSDIRKLLGLRTYTNGCFLSTTIPRSIPEVGACPFSEIGRARSREGRSLGGMWLVFDASSIPVNLLRQDCVFDLARASWLWIARTANVSLSN